MMVSAVSGSGAVPAESDGLGWDEDGFASILASLVGATTPDASVEPAPLSPLEESGDAPVGSESEPGATDEAGVGTAVRGDGPPTSGTHADAAPVAVNGGVLEPPPEVAGSRLLPNPPESPGSLGTGHETPTLAKDASVVPDMDALIVGDVGHAWIGTVALDRMEVVAPAVSGAAIPVVEPASDASLPLESAGVSADRGEFVDPRRFANKSEPAPDVQLEDQSSLAIDESAGSDVADGVRPPEPLVRFEQASGHTPPADTRSEVGTPTDPASDPVIGAETDARVASIREVMEWLEGVGLESTPGEMRVEIPDGDGELVVRVTVVDGRLEIAAAGSEGNLPERWLDDLRRELDARGFDFAGRRQGREGEVRRGDESGTAADAGPPRNDRRARPGVLL
jgi:hypothetical protein